MASKFSSLIQWIMVTCVSMAAGAVANIVLFFVAAFLFAGPEGGSWVRSYFGNGVLFLLVTIMLAAVAFPLVKRLRKVPA